MLIKNLYFEYMYSYEKAELKESDFNSGGVTAIIGRNLDQDTANGSGKSTLLKVIYYMLFGLELNGESVESISNRKFNKGHFGEIVFSDRGDVFRIQRFRDYRPRASEKTKSLKEGVKNTGVRFFINDMPFGDKKASGEAMSVTETQKIIQSRLQISPELFLSSIMTAQDSKSNFLMASDTKKKELLSDLLDLSVYEDAYQIVREEITSVEEQIHDAESRIEEINENIEEKARELVHLREKETRFSLDLEKELKAVQMRFLSLEGEYKSLKREKLSPVDENSLKEKLEIKQAELSEISKNNHLIFESEQIRLLDEQIAEASRVLRVIDSELGKLQAKKEALSLPEKSDLTSLQNQVGFLKDKIGALTEGKLDLKTELKRARQETLEVQKKLSASAVRLESLLREKESLLTSHECPTCERPWDKEHINHRNEKVEKLGLEIEKEDRSNKDLEVFLKEGLVEKLEEAIHFTELQKTLSEMEESVIESEALSILVDDLKAKSSGVKFLLNDRENKKQELLNESRQAASQSQEQIEKLSREIQNLSEDLSKARLLNQAQSSKENQLKTLQERMGELAEQAQEISKRNNPFSELIESTQEKMKSLEDRKKTNSERIKKLEEELRYLNFWKNGFGPTGIRSFISDEVIVEINELVQNYLNELFDGGVSVVFESESVNQKGAVQNKISTKFFLNGKESPLGLLSGGERQRVVLAIDLALSDIAERRSGTKINLKFLDEPFNGIDSSGQMKALSLFSKIANHKSGFFIITHDASFQALCQNTIFIIKKDEVSEVVTREKFRQIG